MKRNSPNLSAKGPAESLLQQEKAEWAVSCAFIYAGDQKHHESERPGRGGDYRLISVAGQSEPAGSNHPAPEGVKFRAA